MSDGIATAQVIAGGTPLGNCPSWPILLSLPPAGEIALSRLRGLTLIDAPGRYATTRLIIAAVILHLPEDPERIALLSGYSAAAGPPPPPGSTADKLRRRTQTTVPAPLSLRLNRLIELTALAQGVRCSRTAIVVAMMQEARRQDQRRLWRERFTRVMTTPAMSALAEVDGGDPDQVLLMTRPRPGPRPGVTV